MTPGPGDQRANDEGPAPAEVDNSDCEAVEEGEGSEATPMKVDVAEYETVEFSQRDDGSIEAEDRTDCG